MQLNRTMAAGSAIAAAGVLAAGTLGVSTANAAPKVQPAVGSTSLATVLTAGGVAFDRNHADFDVVTAAVLAVLSAKPDSPVKVLTDGTVALTAFVPNDQAFIRLANDLSTKHVRSEKAAFKVVAGLGIDTVETVLLYHVVPGATIDSGAALNSNKAVLKTAQGGTIRVRVINKKHAKIALVDKDRNSRDPRVVVKALDINKGNAQIAHGIDRVLRPVDLPPTAK